MKRNISVLTDEGSWMRPYSQRLVDLCEADGDRATLCNKPSQLRNGDVAFFLGCTSIVDTKQLKLHKRNLVVHASDLPSGRGFSPWVWLIIEGKDEIPVCLLEADVEVDAGNIIYKETLSLAGTELLDDVRAILGEKSIELCRRFLYSGTYEEGREQSGEPTHYRRRTPEDSEIDPERSVSSQFDLLRTVDNRRYPAFFSMRGQRYKLLIEKYDDNEE